MRKTLFSVFIAVLLASALAEGVSAASYFRSVNPTEGIVDVSPDSEMSLQRIYFTVNRFDSMSLKIESTPGSVDWVYEDFIIDASGLSSTPKGIVADFRVSRYWVNLNNIQTETIALNYYDGEWQRIEAEQTAEDDDFLYFTAELPVLEAYFAVSGQPLPVSIEVTSYCNSNGACEPEAGENVENCMDCLRRADSNVCVPMEKTCAGSNIMVCNDFGTGFSVEQCLYECAEGECTEPTLTGAVTGFFVAENAYLLGIVALLASVIAFLGFSLKRTRDDLNRIERVATSNESMKNLADKRAVED